MATIMWTGAAGDGNYSNPANWSPAQVPTVADTVTISTAAATAINVSGGAAEALTTNSKVTLNLGENANYTIGTGTAATTFSNGGTFALNGNYYGDTLVIGASKVSLSGGGTILMGDFGGNRISGAAATDVLNNVNNTIKGAGQLGNGALTLINGAAGVIDATGSNGLIVYTGTIAVTNNGLMEATLAGGGGLGLEGIINNGSTGHIAAAGGNVALLGVTIKGGTLSSTGTSAIVDNGNAVLDGTANTVTNTGLIEVTDDITLGIVGTINNTGTTSLQGTYYGGFLSVGNTTGALSTATLTGSGAVTLIDNGTNGIVAGQAGNTLVNLNNIISGAGQIGRGTALSVINHGTVDANVINTLYINTAGVFTNDAVLESTAGTNSGLVIGSVVNNSGGGTIIANGGTVTLSGATIQGGLLTSTAGYAVIAKGTNTLDGTAQAVTNSGSLVNATDSTLGVLGTLNNTGVLSLQSTYYTSNLVVGPGGTTPGTVTLTGGGQVVMGDADSSNRIYGAIAGDTLVNLNNTISGGGALGVGQLNLVNDGTISATGTANALVVQTSSFINNGLLEAVGPAGLILTTAVDDSGGGTLLSNGGTVQLSGGSIIGGTIKSSSGGSIAVNTGLLDGSVHTVTNLGIVEVNTGSTLTVLGTISNQATIGLNSTYYASDLVVGAGTVTLSGGGTIAMSDYDNNRILGATGSEYLNNVNNLIEGAGNIGVGQLHLVNGSAGIIDATATNNQLVIDTLSFTNDGLVESTGVAGMAIVTTVNDTGGGTLLAASSNIYLNGATIQGGLMKTTGTGNFIGNGQTTLDGTTQTVTNTGKIEVSTGDTMTVLGTIANTGTIGLNSSYYNCDLIINSPTLTLTGGGTIAMSDYGANRIYGAVGSYVLDNINNLIEGSGQIGAGQLTLINERAGVIDSTGGAGLTINTGSTVINKGLIETTGTGGLALVGAFDSSSGGTILAASSNVYLNGATIVGGLLKSSGTGQFIGNGQTTLDGSLHTITNAGVIEVSTGDTMTLMGTIANQGTIGLNSSYYNCDLIVASPTLTLTGGGSVVLSNYSGNRIYGVTAADVLNNVNNTISGGGQLGAGQLTLINGGTIEATTSTALVINLGSTGTNTATGKMLAQGSGGLVFQNGTYTNNGLIQAGTGSAVTFQAGAVLTNDGATGVLTGGTYGALSAGGTATATASFTGAAVVTDNANLLLSGVGSEISFGGTTIETSLKSIGAKGTLSVLGGRAYTTTEKITNSGLLALGGSAFTDKTTTNKGTISGFGTLTGALIDTGTIVATGGELTLATKGTTSSIAGTLSGTGTLGFKGVDTLNAGTVLDVSTIALINAATLNLGASVSFGGTFDILGSATLAGPGTFTNNGLFEETGKGLGTISAPFTNTGTISVAAGGTLAFTGGLANSSTILDNGVFTDSAPLTGGSLTVGAAGAAATLGAGSDTISTLTIGGGTLNTSGGTVTVTGDYNNTAAGVGNSYNPFAGVTGTIHGQGTQLAVIGVAGTTITSVNGTLTIMIAAGGTAHFVIENTGAAGSAALRGALETKVNGGTINGTALTGTGVGAQNYGPIAAGSTSGTFTIKDTGGAFSNEAIHLASDFANVAGLTIAIVQQGAASAPAASPGTHYSEPAQMAWSPMLHHA